MSGDFDFAIISPSLVRTAFVAKVQSFQFAVCASSSSVPNLQGQSS